GIVADDHADTVTFRLTKADPDFLYKLAFPMADPVPPGTPTDHVDRKPLPATGPYKTKSFSSGRSWVLVRNRRFRTWSRAAQPDGYPSRIVLSVYPNQEQAVRDVERGTIDVLPSPPTDRIHELATRYANLLHSEPTATTLAFVMNTRVAPF